jgi:signal peptidase I
MNNVSGGESITRTVAPAATAAALEGRALSRVKWALAVAAAALVLLAGARLWMVDGLVRRVTIDGPSMAPAFYGAHYAVRCGDCGFSFRCDAEHLPPDGKAACPNCGFTDNLVDTAALLPAERVLIDRWPLLLGNPRRGDVVAIQRPGGEMAVKRIAGFPGERLAIRDGDLFAGEQILRKTAAELHAVRLLVHDNEFQPHKTSGLPARWRGVDHATRWKSVGTGFRIDSPAAASDGYDWLEYEHWPCTANSRLRGAASPVSDNDGYNQGETHRPLNAVSDVLLTCRLRTEGSGRFAFAVVDGDQRFEVEMEPQQRVVLRSNNQILVDRPLKTNFSRQPVEIEFGLCDQQVLLAVGGRTVVRHEYERPAGTQTEVVHPLAIGAAGIGLQIEELRVWRDVYYLDPQGLTRGWEVQAPLGADEFALLGDNQPVSIDSRQWDPPGVSGRAIVGHVYRPFWIAQ